MLRGGDGVLRFDASVGIDLGSDEGQKAASGGPGFFAFFFFPFSLDLGPLSPSFFLESTFSSECSFDTNVISSF